MWPKWSLYWIHRSDSKPPDVSVLSEIVDVTGEIKYDSFSTVRILDLGLDRSCSSNSELKSRSGVTFQVKLSVNRNNLSAVVDTWAQVTVLRRDLAEKYQIDVEKCRVCSLQGAFELDSKCVYVADNAIISVGNLRTTTSLIITDISNGSVLGGY